MVFTLVGGFEENIDGISRLEVEAWVKDGLISIADTSKTLGRKLRSVACTCFLASRRDTKVSFGAMAMGRAIITTDVPGCGNSKARDQWLIGASK